MSAIRSSCIGYDPELLYFPELNIEVYNFGMAHSKQVAATIALGISINEAGHDIEASKVATDKYRDDVLTRNFLAPPRPCVVPPTNCW